jgi:hypothetical protein
MAQFHVNSKGEAGKCAATQGKCPFGGEDEHYTSLEAARDSFEGSMSEQQFTKFAAPDAHIKEAERMLKALEPSMIERDERQAGGTIRHQLLAEGLTEEELRARSESRIYNGMAGIGERTGNAEGMARVIGLSYAPRSSEYAAVEAIGEALANGDYQAGDVNLMEDRSLALLVVKAADAPSFGDSLKDNKAVHNSSTEAFLEAQKGAYGPNKAKGNFASGEALVIATQDPVEMKMLRKMKDAHAAGALRVGETGIAGEKMFYDDRDISRMHKTREIYQDVTEKHANEAVKDIASRMAEKDPNSYIAYVRDDYAYGIGVKKDIKDADYWIKYKDHEYTDTVYGSFTKAEAERVLEGDGLYILNGRRARR